MSAGVSDQRMKGQGNQVISSASKNVEKDERFIPWSQQVDDAPLEPVPSPTEGSQTGCCESSSSGGGTQFQYPPFKVKDGGSWSNTTGSNNKSSRRLSSSNDNYDSDGTYGSSAYNNYQKNGDNSYNSWSSQGQQHHQQQSQHMNNAQPSRKSNNYDEYYRADRGNYQNDNVKGVQRGMQNMSIEGGRHDDRASNAANTNADRDKSSGQTSSAPKQMTWASIASQPAKQPSRSTRFSSSSSSTLKKKGPGMPPPPMVPGKHNMDIGVWDSPKNGPQLVPPPPPPVIPVPIMEPPLNQNKNSSNVSNSRPPPPQNNSSNSIGGSGGGSGSTYTNNAPPQNRQGYNNQPNRNYNQNNSSNNNNNNNNMRTSWADRDQPPPPPPHMGRNIQNSQNQRPSMHEGYNSSTSRQSSREDYSIHRNDLPHPPQSASPVPPAQVNYPLPASSPTPSNTSSNYALLEELRDKNNYNPAELDLEAVANARFFVIKSYSEDDIHRSIKYGIWCSTEHGNKRLDQAFRERESENGCVYLFFSVNSSGHFCGMARMLTSVDYNSVSNVWSQAKWKGTFKVRWIYVKDVPNGLLRHIRLENNENKSVTNSRDTQEVPHPKGIQVLQVLHSYKHVTSIFDDFFHYEKRQEEEDSKKYEPPAMRNSNHYGGEGNMSPPGKLQRGGDFERGFDKGYSGGSGGGYRDKNFGRGGGFHSGGGGYDNRRQYDDHRGGNGGFERGDRDRNDRFPRDNNTHFNRDRDRENSGGEYNNRGGGGGGFNRNDFRRDDRGDRGGFNRDRDRDNYDDGFMRRGGGGGGGAGDSNGRSGDFNRGDQYNRDRGDHNRGRGRIGQRN